MTKNMPKTAETEIQQASISNTFQNKLGASTEPQDASVIAEVESSAFVCEDLVYRITAVNKHSATVRVRIYFYAKCKMPWKP